MRLKGGDPFIFGVAEKSWKHCERGYSILGGSGHHRSFWLLCLFGYSATHRDYAQSVRLITGHLKTGGELDWENLAVEKQTLVFYMGLNQAQLFSKS
ncbi:hypothetical protein ACNKHM_15100 [Shigella sonnei]